MATARVHADRREFIRGAALAGGALAFAGTVQSAVADEAVSPYAQSQPTSFPADYLVDPQAEWEVVAVSEGGMAVEGLNVNNGVIWFIDVAASRISKIEDGVAVVVYEDETHVAMPNGAKFIDEKTLLITDRRQGLCTFDIETLEYKVICDGCDGQPFLGLNDLVLDGKGGAYFTDPGLSNYIEPNGNIYYVTYGDGSFDVELYKTGIAYPNGITISPDGLFLYVAEFNSNSLLCVPSKDYTDDKEAPYVLARLVGGRGPDGVITDTAGNVYAAHLHAKEVVVIAPNGFQAALIRLPECAGALVSNLLIHDGYLYACEFSQATIWRIPIKAQMNVL